jgi:hypothetical protein
MKHIIAGVLASALAGCATALPNVYFTNPHNVNQDQFFRDRYECLQSAQHPVSSGSFSVAQGTGGGGTDSTVIASCSLMNACLAAKGYFQTDATNGPLVVPGHLRSRCRD